MRSCSLSLCEYIQLSLSAFAGCSGRAPTKVCESLETCTGFALREAVCVARGEGPSTLHAAGSHAVGRCRAAAAGCSARALLAPTVQPCRAAAAGVCSTGHWHCSHAAVGIGTESHGEGRDKLLSCRQLRAHQAWGQRGPLLPSCCPVAPTALHSCKPKWVLPWRTDWGWLLSSRSGGAVLHPLASMQTFPWTPVGIGSSLA